MTTETRKRITPPTDLQMVTMDGRVTQPWHRYLISLRNEAVTSSDDVAEAKTSLGNSVADHSGRIVTLESHFKRTAIEKIGLDSLTVDPTPTYDNIRAIADAVIANAAKLDEIIDALYTSTILDN